MLLGEQLDTEVSPLIIGYVNSADKNRKRGGEGFLPVCSLVSGSPPQTSYVYVTEAEASIIGYVISAESGLFFQKSPAGKIGKSILKSYVKKTKSEEGP